MESLMPTPPVTVSAPVVEDVEAPPETAVAPVVSAPEIAADPADSAPDTVADPDERSPESVADAADSAPVSVDALAYMDPPAYTLALTPTPPETVSAPVVVLSLSDPSDSLSRVA
jgi:hypothetical protein